MNWIWRFLVVTAVLAAFYAPGELTRLLVNAWSTYGLVRPFWLELLLIWVGWSILLFVLVMSFKRGDPKYRGG